LAERTGGDFDTGGVVGLWVAWGDAVELTERLQVIHADTVAEEVEKSILKHAAVAVGEHKSVAVEPIWVLWVEGHEAVEEDVGNGSASHGSTGVSAVRLERRINLRNKALSAVCRIA
jgi:hypothetical protein